MLLISLIMRSESKLTLLWTILFRCVQIQYYVALSKKAIPFMINCEGECWAVTTLNQKTNINSRTPRAKNIQLI